MEYKPWREAIEREVDGLDLDSNQWMDLLLKRTSEIAREFIQHSRDAHLQENPKQALQNTWTAHDSRSVTRQKPAQKLLHSLLRGPMVEKRSIDALFLFAHDCNMAAQLQASNQDILGPLD